MNANYILGMDKKESSVRALLDAEYIVGTESVSALRHAN